MKSNSSNTVKFRLDGGQFMSVYFCFDALRKGFLSGCRPFISVDGCFLKGPALLRAAFSSCRDRWEQSDVPYSVGCS